MKRKSSNVRKLKNTFLQDKKILNLSEIKWINNYHGKVKRNLSRFMNLKEKIDLTEACSPI